MNARTRLYEASMELLRQKEQLHRADFQMIPENCKGAVIPWLVCYERTTKRDGRRYLEALGGKADASVLWRQTLATKKAERLLKWWAKQKEGKS